MKFGAYIDNDALVITYMGRAILKDVTLTPNMTNRGRIRFVPCTVTDEEGRITVDFRRDPVRDWEPELDHAKLILSACESVPTLQPTAATPIGWNNALSRGLRTSFTVRRMFVSRWARSICTSCPWSTPRSTATLPPRVLSLHSVCRHCHTPHAHRLGR